MVIKRVSLVLIPIIINLLIFPTVSAIGDFTVDLYEHEKDIIFSENQTSQTIYLDGVVNYTGISPLGDTIDLFSNFELGEISISPEYMIFYQTGSEEFTVELVTPNIYKNETKGLLDVGGSHQQGGVISSYTVTIYITIINYSSNIDHNQSVLEKPLKDDNLPISSIFMISIIIVIIMIVVIYKKISK
jgi:hypothetical protein